MALKYRNVRHNGYASKREANRAAELHLLEKSGAIHNLRQQVRYELVPADPATGYKRPMCYIADFVYSLGNEVIVEDVKGFRTEAYKIKKRLMSWRHGIQISEI